MVDTRFFLYSGSRTFGELLAEAGVTSVPEDVANIEIAGADEPELAGAGDLVLAASSKFAERLLGSNAGAAIIARGLEVAPPRGMTVFEVDAPHQVFASILCQLFPGVRPVEASTPELEDDTVVIGPNAVIGPDVTLGRGTRIGPNAVIGAGVTIGRDCTIGPGATIECAHIGDDVVIHAGVRIGTEGFGWLDHGAGNIKVPQLGRVIIQDRVEIGANSTVDRGALGDTSIGEGTKIDNLVQIGHNCRIGRNCLIAATSGLSGSTVVGEGVLMGGGVGTSGHLSIGAHSIVHGRAAVTKDWPEGSKLAGAPAQDIKEFWRELAVVRRLAKGKGE